MVPKVGFAMSLSRARTMSVLMCFTCLSFLQQLLGQHAVRHRGPKELSEVPEETCTTTDPRKTLLQSRSKLGHTIHGAIGKSVEQSKPPEADGTLLEAVSQEEEQDEEMEDEEYEKWNASW